MSSLKQNFVYSSILTTANYIFPLITYPYVSRVLGVTNIGICNWMDSIINYVILFSMLGIAVIGNREIASSKNDPVKLNMTFSSLFALNGIFTIVALSVLLVAIFTVPQLYAHRDLMFIGCVKVVANFLLIEWFFRGMEDFRYITRRSIVVRCLYVVAVFLFVRNEDDYIIYYLLISLMFVGNAALNIFHSQHFVHYSFKHICLKKFLKPYLIYGYYALLTSAYTSFNITFLGFVAGEVQVGFYTTATKLFTIILSFFTAVTGVILPRASSLVSEGKTGELKSILDKSIHVLCFISIPCIIMGILLADHIVNILSGKGYEGAVVPMQIAMPLIFIVGYEQILILQGLIPCKKDKAVIKGTTIGAVVGLVLNILLLPYLQSIGAAIVWVASELSVLTCAHYFSRKYLHLHFPIRKFLQFLISYIPFSGMILLILSLHLSSFATVTVCSLILLPYIYFLQRFLFKDPVIMNMYTSVFSLFSRKRTH